MISLVPYPRLSKPYNVYIQQQWYDHKYTVAPIVRFTSHRLARVYAKNLAQTFSMSNTFGQISLWHGGSTKYITRFFHLDDLPF